jgi:hypothetical protein
MAEKGNKGSAHARIIQFLLKGDITLHADEEKILERCTFADGLIRSRKYTNQDVISMISTRFAVSKYTAERDITATHKIFGSTRHISKKYLLGHHIEQIALLIQEAKTNPLLAPFLPKFIGEYTKAVLAMPEDITDNGSTPTLLQFVLQGGQIETGMTADQALVLAQRYMKRKAYAEEIPFEDLENALSDEEL